MMYSDEEEQINSRSNKSKADERKGRLYESDGEEEEEDDGDFRSYERNQEMRGSKSNASYAPRAPKAPKVVEQVMDGTLQPGYSVHL